MMIVDPAGRIRWFNAAAENALGLHRIKAAGLSLADMLTPSAWEQARRILERAVLRGRRCRFEVDAVTADGCELTYQIHASLMHAPGTSPVVLCVAHDISERKSAQRSVQPTEELYQLTGSITGSRLEPAAGRASSRPLSATAHR